MTSIIILCGGDNKRWEQSGGIGRKELVPVNGIPLLAQTIRQLNQSVLVLTNNGTVHKIALSTDKAKIIASSGTKLLTLLDNRTLWSDHTLVICGDVIWTDQWIEELICRPMLRFYGSFFHNEIYALSFTKAEHWLMDQWLAKCAEGELWNLFRAVNDLPQKRHLLDPTHWCEVNTPQVRDFDFKEQYDDWLRTNQ